jgi:hypothetical protein
MLRLFEHKLIDRDLGGLLDIECDVNRLMELPIQLGWTLFSFEITMPALVLLKMENIHHMLERPTAATTGSDVGARIWRIGLIVLLG